MGSYQPKPYRQFNRATGLWVWVYPEPVEFQPEKSLHLNTGLIHPLKPKRK